MGRQYWLVEAYESGYEPCEDSFGEYMEEAKTGEQAVEQVKQYFKDELLGYFGNNEDYLPQFYLIRKATENEVAEHLKEQAEMPIMDYKEA